jgi:hypothetical protein
MRKRISLPMVATAMLMCAANSHAFEFAVNGGFETGDFTGWTQFPSAGTTQSIVTFNPSTGTYAANMGINVGAGAVNNVLKNANLGAGILMPGQTVSVSFDVRGSLGPGAVLFAENFSELAGGGVSFNDLLNVSGSINADPDVWTTVAYDTVLGPDVSGGFTLQFALVCGAVMDCGADVYLDNVSIDAVPIPGAVWLLGSALGLLGWMKRRAA